MVTVEISRNSYPGLIPSNEADRRHLKLEQYSKMQAALLPSYGASQRGLRYIKVACGRVNSAVRHAHPSNVKRKDPKQIIRDSVRRPRLRRIGGAMFFGGWLPLLTIKWFEGHQVYFGSVPATDMVLLIGGGITFLGWAIGCLTGGVSHLRFWCLSEKRHMPRLRTQQVGEVFSH